MSLSFAALLAPLGCDGSDDPAPSDPDGGGGAGTADGETSGADGGNDSSGVDTGADDGSGGGSSGGTGDGPVTVIPDTQDPDLVESTMWLNESCGVDLITTIDWPSFEANFGDGSAAGHFYGKPDTIVFCTELIDTYEFRCRQTDGVPEAFADVGLTQIHCYWDDTLSKTNDTDNRENMTMHIVDGRIQTWGFNFWSANTTDQIHGWIDGLL